MSTKKEIIENIIGLGVSFGLLASIGMYRHTEITNAAMHERTKQTLIDVVLVKDDTFVIQNRADTELKYRRGCATFEDSQRQPYRVCEFVGLLHPSQALWPMIFRSGHYALEVSGESSPYLLQHIAPRAKFTD